MAKGIERRYLDRPRNRAAFFLHLSRYPVSAALQSFLLVVFGSSVVLAQEAEGIRPLLTSGLNGLRQALPNDTRLLTDAYSIETFLKLVDGTPPDWTDVYGHGGHDERLFALNRERDRLREGQTKTTGRVTFFWDGELSAYDPRLRGFRLAIGPRMIPSPIRSLSHTAIVCRVVEIRSIRRTMMGSPESRMATKILFGRVIHISILTSPAIPTTCIRSG